MCMRPYIWGWWKKTWNRRGSQRHFSREWFNTLSLWTHVHTIHVSAYVYVILLFSVTYALTLMLVSEWRVGLVRPLVSGSTSPQGTTSEVDEDLSTYLRHHLPISPKGALNFYPSPAALLSCPPYLRLILVLHDAAYILLREYFIPTCFAPKEERRPFIPLYIYVLWTPLYIPGYYSMLNESSQLHLTAKFSLVNPAFSTYHYPRFYRKTTENYIYKLE